MSSSAHETSFVQQDGKSDASNSNKEDCCENTIQINEQIEAVYNEDVDSTDGQHQNSSQRSQDEPNLKPLNHFVIVLMSQRKM